MHKDEMKGMAKDAKGSIKRGVGKATDDPDLVAQGDLDKAEGKIQKGVGSIKEGVRNALKH
ncbi:MAG: CsbD family protein [Phenylobacterium sp.]